MASRNSTRGGSGPKRPWVLKDIEELIDLLVEREITEFEMERGGFRIRIKRGNPHTSAAPAEPARPPADSFPAPGNPSPLPATPVPSAKPAAAALAEVSAESAEGLYVIKSPIVGTFYGAPAPNAPPFVKPGDVVEAGQVLCIIEAMKLMNDIEAEVSGEIVRIYVENGQPVEYGQSLFAIKPSHKK